MHPVGYTGDDRGWRKPALRDALFPKPEVEAKRRPHRAESPLEATIVVASLVFVVLFCFWFFRGGN